MFATVVENQLIPLWDGQQDWSKFFGRGDNFMPYAFGNTTESISFSEYVGSRLNDRLWDDLVRKLHITQLRIYRHQDKLDKDWFCPGGMQILLDEQNKISGVFYCSNVKNPKRPLTTAQIEEYLVIANEVFKANSQRITAVIEESLDSDDLHVLINIPFLASPEEACEAQKKYYEKAIHLYRADCIDCNLNIWFPNDKT